MGLINDEIAAKMPRGMCVPKPMSMLFDWAEEHARCYKDEGIRVCDLSDGVERPHNLPDNHRMGGTAIRFRAYDDSRLHKYWFGRESHESENGLRTFAWSGGEGSMAAFWLDPAGGQKFVHMGSGSGSQLVCVLADDPIDFLRLLAIGYDEICWDQYFAAPPNTNSEYIVHPRVDFQEWVTTTFGVSIPRTAAEIVRCPAQMDDTASDDPFWKWAKEQAG